MRSSSTPFGPRSASAGADSRSLHAVELSAQVLNALVARTGVDPALVDDVHWGNVISIGQQSGNIGRMAVLGAGWPESVPGFTIDRQCGSSQQAISTAAATVISGQADIIVAGGVEMMSGVPMGAANVEGTGRPGRPRRDQVRRGAGRSRLPRPLQPGRGRGEDRDRVPALADPARRVLRRLARTGGRRPGRGPLRRRDHPRRGRRAGGPARTRASVEVPRSRSWPSSRRRSSKAARSPPATRRRSPTGPQRF